MVFETAILKMWLICYQTSTRPALKRICFTTSGNLWWRTIVRKRLGCSRIIAVRGILADQMSWRFVGFSMAPMSAAKLTITAKISFHQGPLTKSTRNDTRTSHAKRFGFRVWVVTATSLSTIAWNKQIRLSLRLWWAFTPWFNILAFSMITKEFVQSMTSKSQLSLLRLANSFHTFIFSSSIFPKRCLEYKANKDEQQEWQWFDLPYHSSTISEYNFPRFTF